MTEAQHTPGPWFVVPYGDGLDRVICLDEAGNVRIAFMAIAGGYEHQNTKDKAWAEIHANAYLIAASPDLLAAALAIHNHARPFNWDDEDQPGEAGYEAANAWRALDAAIAKAKGGAA